MLDGEEIIFSRTCNLSKFHQTKKRHRPTVAFASSLLGASFLCFMNKTCRPCITNCTEWSIDWNAGIKKENERHQEDPQGQDEASGKAVGSDLVRPNDIANY